MTKEVETAIAGFLKAGQKSLISYKVDESLIGGLVVSIGDKYVDMSMASKIKKYEEIIMAAA
jgi:F-type H+-transporting ATPase subunit O